jgi:hypothetical protein
MGVRGRWSARVPQEGVGLQPARWGRREDSLPTLVGDAEGGLFFKGQAHELFNHLTCNKTLLRFTEAEGAGAHCQMGAGRLAFARMFDWLDGTLAPS